MGIRCLCPNGHRLNIKSFLAGKRGICPECGEKFTIPAESDKSTDGRSKLDSEGQVLSGLSASLPSGTPIVGDTPTAEPANTEPAITEPANTEPSNTAAAKGAAQATLPTVEETDNTSQMVGPALTDRATGQVASGEHLGAKSSIATAPQVVGKEGAVNGRLPSRSDSSPNVSAIDPPEPTAEWFVQIADGQRFGPADAEMMRSWINDGRVAPDNLVHQRGWPSWRVASEVFEELTPAANAGLETGGMSHEADEIGHPGELSLDGGARTAKYRGRAAAKSRLVTVVAALGVTSILLLAALIYVVRS